MPVSAQCQHLRRKLGARRYRVAKLKYGSDMSERDIARTLGIARTTVRRDLAAIAEYRLSLAMPGTAPETFVPSAN